MDTSSNYVTENLILKYFSEPILASLYHKLVNYFGLFVSLV